MVSIDSLSLENPKIYTSVNTYTLPEMDVTKLTLCFLPILFLHRWAIKRPQEYKPQPSLKSSKSTSFKQFVQISPVWINHFPWKSLLQWKKKLQKGGVRPQKQIIYRIVYTLSQQCHTHTLLIVLNQQVWLKTLRIPSFSCPISSPRTNT